MKAKPHLLAGWQNALAFFIITGVHSIPAFSQTFAVNVVAYVDADFVAGSNLVANPLHAGNNTISNLWPDLPDGSYYLAWDNGNQTFTTNVFTAAEGWSQGDMELNDAGGGFLLLPEARQHTWVGEAWTSRCVSFPPLVSYTSILPLQPCPTCGIGPCGRIPVETTIREWDASHQRFTSPIQYLGAPFDGWVDASFTPVNPVPLPPGEAAEVKFPTDSGTSMVAPGVAAPPDPTEISNPTFADSTFRFQFQAESEMQYYVMRAMDLTAPVWEIVNTGIAPTGGGVVTVQDPNASGSMGFYSVDYFRMFYPERVGATFRFQFYAASDVTYTVRRSALLSTGPGSPIGTLTGPSGGGIVTFTDSNATAATGYFP
jgi:hypothetical protein